MQNQNSENEKEVQNEDIEDREKEEKMTKRLEAKKFCSCNIIIFFVKNDSKWKIYFPNFFLTFFIIFFQRNAKSKINISVAKNRYF